MVNDFHQLTVLSKTSILDIWLYHFRNCSSMNIRSRKDNSGLDFASFVARICIAYIDFKSSIFQ